MTNTTSANDTGEVTYRFTHTIGGKGDASDETFPVINPATAAPFAQSPSASLKQLDRAVNAARAAFGSWSSKSFAERQEYLTRFAAKVRERADEIAALITREQGKPLAAAKGEMAITLQALETMSKVEIRDEVLRDNGKNRIVLRFQPLGVIGAITPWNVPVGLAAHKIGQALYTGNTIVLKPSPFTPLSTLLLAEISRGVLPDGVLNVLAGGNELGQGITEHPGIDKITFTGSTATGKKIMASASGSLKRLTLELGGNDPAIILDDADLKSTSEKVFSAAFALAGQVCMAVKRVYVHDKVYDQVCETMATIAQNYRVGEGFEDGVQMGPIQNKMQFEKVLDILQDTKKQPGARILAGGSVYNRPGYFLAPTIVTNIPDDARLVTEEQFGPVLPILRFSSIDDVIERTNNTNMGLCASVWTGDLDKGEQIANRIDAGTVWVNHHGGSEPEIPFGGFKQSGVGRKFGQIGLQSFMEPKVVNVTL